MFTTKLPVEMIETAYTMESYGTISECEVQPGDLGKGSWGVLFFLMLFYFTPPSSQFQTGCLTVSQERFLSNRVPRWVRGQQIAASWSSCKLQATYVHQGWLFFLKISSTEIFIQVAGSRHMCSLKFKDIPTRLCQTWFSPTREDDESRKGDPQWDISSKSEESVRAESMHIITMLLFVISVKGKWVWGNPRKASTLWTTVKAFSSVFWLRSPCQWDLKEKRKPHDFFICLCLYSLREEETLLF